MEYTVFIQADVLWEKRIYFSPSKEVLEKFLNERYGSDAWKWEIK